MRVRWRNFELPTRVTREESTATESYAKFHAEPFERGFGMTVGNSLRRILLSSLEGAAVAQIKIEGVLHEFSTIPGVLEDVTDIILNVKGLLVKLHTDTPSVLKINVNKKGTVTGGDIEHDSNAEIVNADHVIATLTENVDFNVEMVVKKGRGYVTATENEPPVQEIGVIPVDSLFSPVKRVRFRTEDTRVGKVTNYDRLILEIWTNGTVDAEMALVEAAKIFRKHLNPFVQYFEVEEELRQESRREDDEAQHREIVDELQRRLETPITELDLSVRAANCLQSNEILKVGDLVFFKESEILKFKNFGKTSLKEIKKKLVDMGLSLGMDPQFLGEAPTLCVTESAEES